MKTKSPNHLSNTHLLLISFGAIFGSGWLFAPLYAAQIAGPLALFAWILGALMSAVIGITMAEIVVLYPKEGLQLIAKKTHGELISLMLTFYNLLVFIILPAIEVRAVLQYVSSYPDYRFLLDESGSFSTWAMGLALLLLFFVSLANFYGSRLIARITQVVVFFKIVTPILLCASFLYAIGSEKSLDFSRLNMSQGSTLSILQAVTTSGIIFSFNGFNQATLFAGEAKNPQRAVPFAILGSLLLSCLLYLLIQYVFLMAVPESSFSQGWSQLTFPGDSGPFAGLASLLGLTWLLSLIYADAVISPLGTAFSYASAAPRIIQNSVTQVGAQLNQSDLSPQWIALAWVLEALAFILLPSLKSMITVLVAAFVLCYTVAPASLLKLRKLEPHTHRPFRVKWAPLTSFFAVFFSNLMVFSCGWVALRNLILMSLALVLFHAGRHQGRGITQSLWFLVQLLTLGILSLIESISSSEHFLIMSFAIALLSAISLFGSQIAPSRQSLFRSQI